MDFLKNLATKYLVDDWVSAWKFASVWMFVLIGCAPELYNLSIQYNLVEAGAVPELFSKAVSMMAFVGAASRVVRQKRVEMEADEN